MRTESTRVPSARRRLILDYLEANSAASISQLAGSLGVSAATVHRDLRTLEQDGLLNRVQGGATAISTAGRPGVDTIIESSWRRRLEREAAAKLAIGVRAGELVAAGDMVFIDGSTTGLAVAAAIEASGVAATIVTTSPAIAQSLTSPHVHLVMVPGEVDQELRIITGSWTNEFLSTLNFSAAFISCGGAGGEGVLFTERREIQVTLQTALSRARRKVAVLDASKLGRTASMTLCAIDDLDVVVVDSAATPAELAMLREHDADVLVGELGATPRAEASAIVRTFFS